MIDGEAPLAASESARSMILEAEEGRGEGSGEGEGRENRESGIGNRLGNYLFCFVLFPSLCKPSCQKCRDRLD